ncbi:CBF/Mak21 family-domain-containing protein [Tuber brumale]|nr:CBF/Mak21 family-domain-containing protein [Tuber brumale]
MAKKHSSKSKAETPAAPPTTSEMPVFSADALSKLTERIQLGFDDTKRSKKGDNKNSGKQRGAANGGKRDQGITEPTNGNLKKTYEKKPHERSKKLEQRKAKPTEIPNVPRGKKRARDSDIPKPAQAEKPNPKPSQPANKTKDGLPRKPGKKGGIDKERLLKEIIELGGTQEDLDLVDGIDSDEDEEEVVFTESGKSGKRLQKELQGFLKEIGLEAGKFSTVEDEYEDEDEEWVDEDSGEGGEDAETEDEDEEGGMDDAEEEPKASAPTVKPLETRPDPKLKGSKLKMVPRPDWHAYKLPPLASPKAAPSAATIRSLHEHAKSLLQTENAVYSATHLTKSSDRQFLSTIMTSGTLSDKISALTLICQESPLHTIKSLETLLGLARKKSRSQVVSSMAAIKDLFGPGSVLPEDRKLRFFSKQPEIGAKEVTEEHLIIWAYEDWLKNFYFEVLTTLEGLCTDPLVFPRINAVGFIHSLLSSKPEQEANLLRLLVNKLGDSDKKVASKVSYLLLQLQTTHPAMRIIIVSAIESEVLFRPGNGLNAKYYAIITLNQTILSTRDNYEVANKLLGVYFATFTSLLQGEPTATASSGGAKHIKLNDPARPPPRGKMNRKAKARAKVEETNKQFLSDLIAKLLSAILTGVNRAFPFSQVDDDVFEKHIDTLFKITHSGNFNTSIQAMMLIFQVSNSKQAVSDRFYRTLYESLLDQRLVDSSKQAMYLNLLFRALKADAQVKRVKAFVKRLIQIAATFHQPPFICGVLYLLNELCDSVPSSRSLLEEPEQLEDDEDEVFKDAPEEGEEQAEDTVKDSPVKYVEYDGRRRDPLFTNADRTCLWELMPLLRCYHPSVALFATSFLEHKPMPSKPDLGIHTLAHFLDRFVYRNAKATPTQSHGSSIMQPLGGGDTRGVILSTRGVSKSQIPVNSEAFWKRKVEDVDVDEVFFHKYFNQIAPKKSVAEKKKAKKAERGKEGEDDVEVSEDESEIWKAMVHSRPDIEEGDVDFDDEDNTAELSDISDDGDEGMPDLAEDEDDVWGSEDEGGDHEKEPPRNLQKAFKAELETATGRYEEEDVAAERENKKRRKLKHLPTFASAEDYAHMLDG